MSSKKTTLSALSAAAVMLNGLSSQAVAEGDAGGYSFEYLYSKYQEDDLDKENLQLGSVQRYEIDTHQILAVIPMPDDSNLSINAMLETMSGASPWFVMADSNGDPIQVMSGATIEDTRGQVSANFFQKHEGFDTSTSLSYSKEKDYDALTFGVAGVWYFNNRLTTFNYGLSGGQDHVHPTQDTVDAGRVESEAKSRLAGYVGFSQVMTANRLVGAEVGISSLSGYLSDPYKLVCINNVCGGTDDNSLRDTRPDRKRAYSLSANWREFVPKYNGAFHTDLGLYHSNWETTAVSTDFSWYQNFGYNIQVVPSFRYYRQTAATFYAPFYTERRSDGYYSSDYRLSEFSSVSGRLKVNADWKKVTMTAGVERYQSFGDHPGLVDFTVISVGLSSNF